MRRLGGAVKEYSEKGEGSPQPVACLPSPQDNASKLLLGLMESRHDSENAERILISLRPQELVRLVWPVGGKAPLLVCVGMGIRAQPPGPQEEGILTGTASPGGRHQEGLPAGGGA